jgi:hypothetical protein
MSFRSFRPSASFTSITLTRKLYRQKQSQWTTRIEAPFCRAWKSSMDNRVAKAKRGTAYERPCVGAYILWLTAT